MCPCPEPALLRTDAAAPRRGTARAPVPSQSSPSAPPHPGPKSRPSRHHHQLIFHQSPYPQFRPVNQRARQHHLHRSGQDHLGHGLGAGHLDAQGHRRLGDKQPIRGCGKGSGLGHLQKGLDPLQIHESAFPTASAGLWQIHGRNQERKVAVPPQGGATCERRKAAIMTGPRRVTF